LKTQFPNNNNIDYILIEHQGDFRPFMKSLQVVIYTYFKLQNKDVRIRHAIDKFKSNLIDDNIKSSIKLKKSKYQNNKLLSVEYVKQKIPSQYIEKYILDITCIDDYADALFQAIDFIHKIF
jgi:hypothetical protein